MSSKKDLRRAARACRAALSGEERARATEVAARHALPLCSAGEVVALYMPVRDELSPLPLASMLHEKRCTLVLPVVEANHCPLQFRHWQPGDLLKKGLCGVEEPLLAQPQREPAFLFVPLLAFDGFGNRLGTGGGYYDRTLQALRASRAIRAYGFAYACQRVDELPLEPHDEKLDGVVTEQGVLVF